MTKAAAPKPRAKAAPANQVAPAAANDRGLAARAGDALDDARDGIAANPIAAVLGGAAIGVLAGVLAPRSEREAELLGPLGAKLNEGAVTAAKAARDAGKAELAAIGLSRVGANEQVGKLIEGIGKAFTSAGQAARETRGRKNEG